MTKNQKDLIQILEHVFNFQLSNEQMKILKYNHKTPILVNSCAGAGKTTLILFDIFFRILSHKNTSQSIIDITFSKKAQEDMVNKYSLVNAKLQKYGLAITGDMPYFCTFHALFYRLLRHFKKYKNIRVITTYHDYEFNLIKAMVKPPKHRGYANDLNLIFGQYNGLMAHGYSHDGLHLTKLGQKAYNTKSDLVSDCIKSVNYVPVIKKYKEIKSAKRVIDFNDMVMLLAKALKNKTYLALVKDYMRKFKLCYIDEFQDISNIQWWIMKMILDESCFSQLSAIGDDDQSIYSFRGANPSIIINFTKDIKNAKLFHLSTNYRTNPKVLSGVKPVIESNKYRINKKLLSPNNANQSGGLFQISDSYYFSSGRALLRKAWQMYQNNKYRQAGIAILCRYNAYKLVATDFFANHNVYTQIRHPLQDSNIYKIIYNIIYGLVNDDINPLAKYARYIGDNDYTKHLLDISQMSSQKGYDLKTAMDDVVKLGFSMHLQYRNSVKTDQSIALAINLLHGGQAKGAVAFNEVRILTHNYFSYMLSHHYMNGASFNVIVNYLEDELSTYQNVGEWLTNEQMKWQKLVTVFSDSNYKSDINILTIHQSKGLQFGYVFMYGLTDQRINDTDCAIEKYFKPYLTKKNFLDDLLKLNKKQTDKIDGISDKSIVEVERAGKNYNTLRILLKTIRDGIKRLDKKDTKQKIKQEFRDGFGMDNSKKKKRIDDIADVIDFLKNHKTLKVTAIGLSIVKPTIQLFDQLYKMTLRTCDAVEEENRLIYVGCTRSTNSTIFNVNINSNPLLAKLNVNKHNKFLMNASGKLIPIINDKLNKKRFIDTKIKELEDLKKKL